MLKVPMYTVDAFASELFSGNTCAVCLFSEWPEDAVLQKIAKQNLFAETAFILTNDPDKPQLRWFTTSQEVTFCGYGTLSAAYVYLNYVATNQDSVIFQTRHYGEVTVKSVDDVLWMETPLINTLEDIFDENVYEALGGVRPQKMITSQRGDLTVMYKNEQELLSVMPDFNALMKNGYYGYILSSIGESSDYAYRYFSPRMPDVWEDPVNGSSQSILAPYWAQILGKSDLHGVALSARGGDIYSKCKNTKTVHIGGKVVSYMEGSILLPF